MITKLTPNVPDPAPVAAAAEEEADAVSLINTLRSRPLDPETGEPWLGEKAGPLGGDCAVSCEIANYLGLQGDFYPGDRMAESPAAATLSS